MRGMASVPVGRASQEAFAMRGMAEEVLGSWLPMRASLDMGLL